ncbi:MFS transporter [Chitinophaga pendula]|uniref:MFS transporter n=1 Tax=Chitinophaga TaxID=79328 RepID=UPI000BAFE868|nr:MULTISPECIES: MFS transporter [Chitinophaga]ASZ12694.1 MFS transporter [Chitinophaga sp. MD30]UCJ09694.1 MFS transporter [Chitinophaga pendula]
MKHIKYIAAFGVFGIITTEFGVIGILPQIATHYGIGIDHAGWLLSAFALVIALCGPWITLLAAGKNRKVMMSIALGLFILSNAISALAPPFSILLLARMLPAFLHPLYISAAIAAAVATANEQDKHKATAVVFAGVSLGTVIGVPFVTYLAEIFSWQVSFIGAGIVNTLALAALIRFIPELPAGQYVAPGKQLRLLADKTFLLHAISTTLMLAAMFAVYGYFADYMVKVNHLSGVQVGNMLLLFGVTGVVGNWVAGKLLGKSIPATLVGVLLSLLVIYSLLFFTNGYNTATMLLIAVWGFVHTACFIIGQAWINSAAPHAQEFANSLGISFGNLGLTAGTMISGWVIAGAGVQYTAWVSLALVSLSLAFVGYRLLTARRTARKDVRVVVAEEEAIAIGAC